MTELRRGDRVAERYEILEPVGAGGMGVVFAARRLALDDVVALKCIHPDRDTPSARARFVREARAMARIRHPNVVQVFDFGDAPNTPAFLVMELLRGPSLAEVVADGPLEVKRTIRVFTDVCSAVEAGHRRGVVHRDLKPGNVVLSRDDDGGETVKVLDFGLARLVGDDDGPILTQVGSLVGTVAYMSPEQIEGGDAGTASDVWALGTMLFELVTGELPFRGGTPVAAIMKIAEVNYPDPRTLVPDLPEAVLETIRSALQRDPADRPASATALAEKLSAGVPRPRTRLNTDAIGIATADLVGMSTRAGSSGELSGARTSVSVHGMPSAVGSRAQDGLVARDDVFETLDEEFETARHRSACRLVVVRGDPGVGKTAVVERFLERVGNSASIVAGRFYAYEGDRPPPAETFWWMLDGRMTDALGDRTVSATPQTGRDKWRSFEELAQRFAELAAQRPLIVALEDMQWATGLELEFIAYLHRALEGRPALLLTTARSAEARTDARTELSNWILKFARQHPGQLTSFTLEPFDDEQILAWLGARLGRVRIQPAAVRRLRKLTGGNPAYLEEVLRHLRATGAVTKDDLSVHIQVGADAELPASVAQAVLANLADLDPEVRDVLEAAAVVGEELRFETVQTTVGLDEDVLEDRLERACRRGVLSDRGTTAGADYRFVSPAIRSALYEGITKRRRRRLHRSVVEALQMLYASDLERIAKILCVHQHATRNWEATVEWGLVATENTLAAFDADSAAASLGRAEEGIAALVEAGTPPTDAILERARLLSGILNNRLGHGDIAAAALGDVVAAARARGDELAELTASLELGESHVGRGDLGAATDTAERTLELALRVGSPQQCARARVLSGSIHARLGRYDDATDVLAPVLADHTSALSGQRALALREQAWVETRRGEMKRADVLAREAMALADAHDDPLARYFAISVRAVIQAEGGHAEAARALYDDALRMARALSLRRREMIETANSAMTLGALGRLDEALTRMLQTRAICLELGDRASLGDCLVGTAQVLLLRGDLDEAMDSFERGRALADETGRVEYALIATLELGDLELRRDDNDAAVIRFRDALDRLTRVESLYAWRAHHGMARALDRTGTARETALEHARLARDLIEAVRSKRVGGEDELLTNALADLDRMSQP